jgi:hypothetical protein
MKNDLPPWDDDKRFGLWLNQMLDAEQAWYDENEWWMPDAVCLRGGRAFFVNASTAIEAAEDLEFEHVASLIEKGPITPLLQRWLAAQLKTGFKARKPRSKKIAHAAEVLDHMRRLCRKHYHRKYRARPLKSLIEYAAERCKIEERSLRKHLKGR